MLTKPLVPPEPKLKPKPKHTYTRTRTDPNIPFVPEITPDIPYSEPGKCYDLCHLSENLTELVTDSLSKYEFDRCPDRGSIAGEVRSESALAGGEFSQAGNDSGGPILKVDSHDYTEINAPGSSGDEQASGGELASSTLAEANQSAPDSEAPPPTTKVILTPMDIAKNVHVHRKKLDELRELLANYQNQAKTHRYHAEHSSAAA